MAAHPDLPLPGERLHDLLLGLCRQARADLRRLQSQPESAVHALRVRMKKLRAVLRLARTVLPKPALQSLCAEARAIRQTFGASRDAEVARHLAAKLAEQAGLPLHAPDLPPLAPEPAVSREVIRRRLGQLEQRLADLPLASLILASPGAVWVEQYRRCRRLCRRCQRDPRAQTLHAWRKRVKELEHLGLALVALRVDLPAARHRIRPARELGRQLGRLQDLAVLAAALPADAGKEWRRLLAQRRRRLLRRVFACADRCLATPARKLPAGGETE
jgi:CHAD domain-containing protein